MSRRKTLQLDDKLDYVKDRLKKTVDIALERVIAHNENPGYYPLPTDPKSLERALHNLFEALPRKNKKDLIEKVNKTLKAGREARTRMYGEMVDIDFRSPTSVAEQAKTKPVPDNLKFTEADMPEIRSRLKLPPLEKPQKRSKPVPAQAVEAAELGFEVVSLTCNRTSDVRKDEVNLAGVAVDDVGGQIVVDPFFVGDFKKGDTLALGANGRLFTFKLAGEFPKTFFAAFFIVEKDLARDSKFIRAMIGVLYALTIALMVTVFVVAALLPGARALIIGILIGFVVTGTGAPVLRLMKDDVSFGVEDSLVLAGPVAPGVAFDRVPIIISVGAYKGEYRATTRWITA